jgi:hypothetical protein
MKLAKPSVKLKWFKARLLNDFTGFLLGLQFDPEDLGDMFLQNVGSSLKYSKLELGGQ